MAANDDIMANLFVDDLVVAMDAKMKVKEAEQALLDCFGIQRLRRRDRNHHQRKKQTLKSTNAKNETIYICVSITIFIGAGRRGERGHCFNDQTIDLCYNRLIVLKRQPITQKTHSKPHIYSEKPCNCPIWVLFLLWNIH